MSDVIDILHRLSYEVNDGPIQQATQSIKKQIQEVERLEKEVRELSKEFARTSETDIAKREELIKKINTNRNAISSLNDEIHENILTNKELHKVLEKEQGIIGGLNTQLDLLRKKRDAATDPKSIQDYNKQIASVSQRLALSTTQQGGGGGNPTASVMATSNIIRDAPFGVMGISNNVTQLSDSLTMLNKQTGSTGASLKLMASSLIGPAGIGIGISVVTSLLTVLVQKYGSLGNAIDSLLGSLSDAEKAQQALSNAMNGANKEYEKAVVTVSSLRNNIKLAKEGIIDKDKVVKEYNESIGKTTGAVKSLDEAEKELNRNAQAYIKFTLLKAAANIALQDAAKKAFEAEMERQKTDEESVDYIFSGLKRSQDTSLLNTYTRNAEKNRQKAASEAQKDANALEKIANSLNDQAAAIAKQYGFDFFAGSQDSKKQVENVYLQKLAELKNRLASLTVASFQSDDNIRKKVSEQVIKGQQEMDRMFKEKRLTSGQRDTLRALVGTIGEVELKRELEEFNKKRLEAQRRIDNELNSLLLQEGDQRIQLIKEDFDRQSAIIDQEYQKQLESLRKAQEQLLQDNEENRKVGLIDERIAQENASQIRDVYERLLNNLVQLTERKRALLALSLFDDAIFFEKTFFSLEQAEVSEKIANEIKVLANAYIQGEIAYQNYQDNLTKILRGGAANRRELNIRELEDELRVMEDKLAAAQVISNEKDINVVLQRIASIRDQIANLKKEAEEAGVSENKESKDVDLERLKARIEAYGDLTNAAINAYRTIISAQEEQVNRDIENQQRRVDRATAIADRGNAKVLEAEEKRLSELSKEREKFARQQLVINAAQTASSSILAVANAASTGDPYSGVARVAAIIAALGAGFALVTSLSRDNVQSFSEGEIDISGPGTTTSDSIPAWLSRGESVINAKATARNRKVLEAINAGAWIDPELIEKVAIRPETILPVTDYPSLMIIHHQAPGQDISSLFKEVQELKKAIIEKPTSTWHLDRRGFVTMYQDEINFQDKMNKL